MGQGLHVGLLHRVEAIDPHRSLAHASEMVERQVFETLYRRADGRLVPEFFSGRLEARDGFFEATLREGLKFSDGSPLTAAEVQSSLQRSGRLPAGSSVEAEGLTLRVRSTSPIDVLRETLSVPATAIAKRAHPGEQAPLIGTGPYKLADVQAQDRLSLARNPHHAGPRAAIEHLHFIDFRDEPSLADAVARGHIDFTVALSPRELPSGSFVRTSYLPTPSTALLWLNCERIADARVRRALAYAIDRARVLDLSYPGAKGLSAHSSLPQSLSQTDACDDQTPYDPKRSAQLIEQAKFQPSAPLKLMLIWGPRPYLPAPLRAGEELAAHLGSIGVAVSIEQTRDPTHYAQTMAKGEFDLALGGWYADDPSPYSFLNSLYASTSIPESRLSSGRCNFARWRDTECDRALERLRDAPHDAERIAAVAHQVREGCPAIALHHGAATIALGHRVRGREFDGLGFPRFSSFTLRPTPGPRPS